MEILKITKADIKDGEYIAGEVAYGKLIESGEDSK
jgi:hypothetical protein